MKNVGPPSTSANPSLHPTNVVVDIAGLSLYSFGLNKLTNRPPADNLFRTLFQPFYDLLTRNTSSSPLGLTAPKPLVIAETSAPFYYDVPAANRFAELGKDVTVPLPYPNLTTLEPAHAPGAGANDTDELYIKATWFVQLTSNDTATMFPALKAITWVRSSSLPSFLPSIPSLSRLPPSLASPSLLRHRPRCLLT